MSRTEWEYKVVEATKYFVASKLEEMTKAGWKMISTASCVEGGLVTSTTIFMFFKRPKED